MAAASGQTRLQIVVAPDQLSCKALQYILDNLDILRRLDVHFTVIRVPTEKEKLAPLVSRGITNTPTLVMPNGKLLIGLDAIKKIVDKNVSRVAGKLREQEAASSSGMNSGFTRTGDEFNDWMLANAIVGAPKSRKGRVTQMGADDDESMGENANDDEQGLPSDFSSRMANFESRRKIMMPPDPYGNTPREEAPRRRRPNNNARAVDSGDDGGFGGGEIRRNVGNMIDDGDDFNNSPAMGRRTGGGVPKLPAREKRGANVSEAEMERMMMEAMVDSRDGPGGNGRGY